MDDATANGIPVNIFAQKMLKAIAKSIRLLLVGKKPLGYILKVFPSLLVKIVRKAKVV